MVSQVAKEVFKVPHVIARIYDPDNVQLFNQIDVKTIIPMNLAETALNQTFDEITGDLL
jgi:trk system potassium uptake protein TrkA